MSTKTLHKPFYAFNVIVLMLALFFGLSFAINTLAHFYSFGVNETDSEPEGIYFQKPIQRIEKDEMLSVQLPDDSFALKRGYIDRYMQIIKRVGAVPGEYLWTQGKTQYVCDQDQFNTSCRKLGQCLSVDSKGRPMPCQHWQGQQIPANHYYMYSNRVPNSVDSRYLGLIERSQLTHHETLLWEFS